MPQFREFLIVNDEPYDPPYEFSTLDEAQAYIKEYALTNVALYRLVPRGADASYDYEVEGWFST